MFDCDEFCTSDSDESLSPSPIYDGYRSGDGYHVVPPPYTRTFMPPKPNLVFHDAPNVNETVHTAFNIELSPTKPDIDLSHTHRPSAPIIEDWVSNSEDDYTSILTANHKTAILKPKNNGNQRNRKACFVCKSLDHLIKDCNFYEKKMAQIFIRNHAQRGYHQQYARMTLSNPQKHVVPTAVLTKSKLVPITTARPLTAVVPKPNVTSPRQAKTVVTKPQSPPRRNINRSLSPKASTFPPNFRPCFPQYKCINDPQKGNPQHALKDKGVIDSGCSRYMIGNMSYLFDFEELNGGYVAFGGFPKGGKFDGKVDEGFLVGYSVSSKAFRNTDDVAAFGGKKPEFEEREPQSEFDVSPGSKFEDFFDDSINEVNAVDSLVLAVGQISTNSTNTFSAPGPSNVAVSLTHGKYLYVNTSQYHDDPNMLELEEITYSDDEEDVGADANFTNLETSITEEVYVFQPLGFEDPDYPDKVYKVIKALYGLHQARKSWQKQDGIFISQDKYVAEILRKFSLKERKSGSTPIDTKKPLLKDPDGEDVDMHTYRSMIGSLMYLTSSRPDIMFALLELMLSKRSRKNTKCVNAASEELTAAKHKLIVKDLLSKGLPQVVSEPFGELLLKRNSFLHVHTLHLFYFHGFSKSSGDSPVPTRIVKGVVQPVAPTTAKQKLARKNELKARGTLLMTLPDNNQLKFNSHKDAKTLMKAIEKRFRGNTETKKVQKTLLKKEFENFSGSSSEGLYQIHGRLQKLVRQLKIHGVSLSQEDVNLKFLRSTDSHNLAFVSSTSTDSTTDSVSAAVNVSAVGAKLTSSTLLNVGSLSNACDGTRTYDWSYQVEEEPTKFPLMDFSSSSSNSSSDNEVSSCSKACSKTYSQLQTQYDTLTKNFRKSQFDVISYRKGLESVEARLLVYKQNESILEENIKLLNIEVQLRDTALTTLRQKLNTTEKERDDLNMNDSDSWPPSNLYDRFVLSGGYHAIPPLVTGTFMPPKPDLVFHTPHFDETKHLAFNVQISPTKPEQYLSSRPSSSELVKSPRHYGQLFQAPILIAPTVPLRSNPHSKGSRRSKKACFVCKSVDHLIKDCDFHVRKLAHRTYASRDIHKQTVSAVKPIFSMTRPKLASRAVSKSKSPLRRHLPRRPSSNSSNSPPRVTAAKASAVSAAQDKKATWVWRPKCLILNHALRTTSASMTLKRFDYNDALGRSESGTCPIYLTLKSLMEDMLPLEVTPRVLPIQNPNEFDLWKMMIEQYFLMTDYSLWEVILNGDSLAPTRVIKGVVQPVAPTTTEQRLARKNELKARGTLLMALPVKHQLKFNIHKDAKTLMEAIEKSLPTEWRTHTLIWRNKTDLEEQSLDDLFNSLKIYEAKVKSSSPASTSTQNIAFVSSNNTDSTNEPVSAVASVSAASAKFCVSALPSVDTLSNAVIYLFFASQYNDPQLDNDDLKQIDADDLKEMDLKWQIAMLTVRARRFLQRTGRNLRANRPTSMGFDMSKVECYNFHRKGHFVRECRSPKDTRRNAMTRVFRQKRNLPTMLSWPSPIQVLLVLTMRLKKLISQLEILGESLSQEDINLKFLRSLPTEWRTHTLIWRNKTDLEEQSLDDLFNSLKIYEAKVKSSFPASTSTQNIAFVSSNNTDITNEPVSAVASVSAASAKFCVSALPRGTGLAAGMGTFMPPKPNLVFHDAPNVNEIAHTAFNVEISPTKPDTALSHTHRPSAPIIEDWVSDSKDDSEAEISQNASSFVQPTEQVKTPRHSVKTIETSIPTANHKTAILTPKNNGNHKNRKACFVCKSLDHLIKDYDFYEKKMAKTHVKNHAQRGNHQQYARMTLPNPQRHVVPLAVLTKSKLVPIPAARPVPPAVPKPHVTRPRQAKTVVTKSHSPSRRHINRSLSPKASTFPLKVIAAEASMVNVIKGNWVWKPRCPILDHVYKCINDTQKESLNDTPSVAWKFLNEVKDTLVTLQRVVKPIMNGNITILSSLIHQEIHKIFKDEITPIVNQVDVRKLEDENVSLEFQGDETNALCKPVTLNSVPITRESTIVKNDEVIAPGISRINPFKTSKEAKHVPNKPVKASGAEGPDQQAL
uniref:CCHC-type domain-containing protein n=1 Tax=Tanacetum cinerariifolium TaxID=118510 RepID=A0A6L2MQJ9_TANCI|nr:hypothetical protein [Tanacetum cinerariifolium]